MPRIRKPPPPAIMDHLIERYRDGRVAIADFVELKHWLETDPEVPAGMWYKRFKGFILAGEGEMPKTFLTPGMSPKGQEIE